jgi:hypothetical protein
MTPRSDAAEMVVVSEIQRYGGFCKRDVG